MSAQRTEFRVVWKREGRERSTRIYQSWNAACRKAAGVAALEAVKDQTRFETLPDLEEQPVIEQRTVGDWEVNPHYLPGYLEGAKENMLALYRRDESEVVSYDPF